MPSRVIFHPILENRRSRLIFFIFLLISASLGAACWLHVKNALSVANVQIDSVLLTKMFWIPLVVITTIIATVFTAWQVVGPTARIEQWLRDWNDQLTPFPLLVRKNDKFARLAELLNKLYQKMSRPAQN